MNKGVAAWAGGVLTVLGLIAVVARGAVRLNVAEEKANKVDGVEHQVKVMTIFMKLQDSTKYRQAEYLAN